MSEFTDVLLVSPMPDGRTWAIWKEFTYHVGQLNSGETITVPLGFRTDFASVPPIFRFLVPRWGKYGKAAIVHDFCYWKQQYPRERADEIFREAMGVSEVARWRIFVMYRAVRLFGGRSWRGNQKLQEQGYNRVLPLPEKAADTRRW